MKHWVKETEGYTEVFERVTGTIKVDLTGFKENNVIKEREYCGYKTVPGGIMIILADNEEEITKNGYIISEVDYGNTRTIARVAFGKKMAAFL